MPLLIELRIVRNGFALLHRVVKLHEHNIGVVCKCALHIEGIYCGCIKAEVPHAHVLTEQRNWRNTRRFAIGYSQIGHDL